MAAARRSVTSVVAVAVATVLVACTGSTPSDEPSPTPSPRSVPLRVETVAGAGTLGEQARTELETAVGDVLSHYVVRAFLGDFPRQDFVPAFESFTSGAARQAALDIDRLTAARVQDATEVRATRLDARLSFLVEDEDVHGATATVRFEFEALTAEGETQPVTLRGRFMLEEDAGTWSVFGYDVALDDGAAADTEVVR